LDTVKLKTLVEALLYFQIDFVKLIGGRFESVIYSI